ncbi:MAG: PEP-CTERM sorting domain-containing protein [Opitutaceae bacterium]|nr:PEP-CTERM sorting domain-containing protein [Cephaloticoccus sp.]MCP5528836.1 PEP-CTERM sorting domain-containing protein [Opitutaceae bacterium]
MKFILSAVSLFTLLGSLAHAQTTTISFNNIVVESHDYPGTTDLANLTLTIDTSTLTGGTGSETANITSWELSMTRYYTGDLWIDVDNSLPATIFAQGSNYLSVNSNDDTLSIALEYQASGDPSGTYSNGVGDPQVNVGISLISGGSDFLSTNNNAIGEFIGLSSAQLSSSTFGVSYNYDSFNGYLGTGGVSAVPEPSTYAAILGLLAIGFVAWRKRAQTRTGKSVG